MPNIKDIVKDGWHPEKDGTWKGDIKGQVAGWMGKGKDSSSPIYSTPYERKDPSLFPPPPKHKGTIPVPGRAQSPQNQSREEEEQQQSRESVPFRADNTGVDMSRFPAPPQRREGHASGNASSPPTAVKPKPPQLPPRLPPRDAVAGRDSDITRGYGSRNATSPTRSELNQGAVSSLSSRGVSVPAFGIGRPSPSIPPRSPATSLDGEATQSSSVSDIQTRLSALTTSSQPSPSSGTSWAEKRGALETARKMQQDPSSVSLKDARKTASVAQNFHQRHGDQVASGIGTAGALNQKYGIAGRINAMKSGSGGTCADPPANSGGVGKKPPPPPPPPGKPKPLASGPPEPSGSQQPPPVPLQSKPGG